MRAHYLRSHQTPKAFTVAALGILIDEGKLTWETKVIDIIPEFRLYNAYVTEDFNIKDLLTHRSGLGARRRRPDDVA
ncbi:MAG: serine hydrolase [Marinilabiliales bacterium]|nr:serine hydrolase [Marinilabiliales bacterium]